MGRWGLNQISGDGPLPAARMTGLTTFVVEDEFLLACSLAEELKAFGHTVIGPYGDRVRAAQASRGQVFDLAILDINLAGDMVYPLADELAGRNIPFIFLTGYGTLSLPARFRACRRLSKPYDVAELMQEVERVSEKRA